MCRRRVHLSLGVMFMAALCVAVSRLEAAQQSPSKRVCDRLGGVYSIATVVDEFIDRWLVNDTFDANAAIRDARTRVPTAGLTFQLTALVCGVSGVPATIRGDRWRKRTPGSISTMRSGER
jgi:hemoglobin